MKRSWATLVILTIISLLRPLRGEVPTKIYVTLWWDTEDFVLPASDDAALRVARWLSQQGIRSTFKVVGEKARTLERRRRMDVIEALKNHEIGYHAEYHSVHPTPAQYLASLGWDEGVAEFDRRERRGFDDVKRIFGQHPSCYGQPGSSWAPQSYGALKKWGVPVYLDSGNHIDLNGEPLYYCGIATFYRLRHTLRANLGGPDDLKAAQTRFLDARRQIAQKGSGVVSIYYHPCEFVHRQFWDGVNFARGANPPLDRLQLPPMKSEAETAIAYQTFEEFIRFIKSFPEVRFVTASELGKIYRDQAFGRLFSRDEIRQVAERLQDSISFQVHGDWSLSAAEALWLIARSLSERRHATKNGNDIRLERSPLGPTNPPATMSERVSCTRHQFETTLADVLNFMVRHDRIPSTIWLGSEPITPEAFLSGLAREFVRVANGDPLSDSIEFRPVKFEPAQYVADDAPRLWGWVIFPPGFRAPKMMELARWQAWTIKPAIHHGLDR